MPVNSSAFNILERLIHGQIHDGISKIAPRLLLRRHSVLQSELPPWFSEIGDKPRYPLSSLLENHEHIDWTPHVRPDAQANRAERELLELDFGSYSDLTRDSQRRVVFAFSPPVLAENGWLMYGVANFGPLAARGFLCSFEGTFEAPTEHEILPVWQS